MITYTSTLDKGMKIVYSPTYIYNFTILSLFKHRVCFSSNFSSPMNLNQEDQKELVDLQLKFCSTLLTKLKRNVNATPFLKPVDPIALGIPDYPEKIKHPMDISTVKNKLDLKQYHSPDEFNSDMLLMFNNCYSYNHPDSVVYGMGKDLQRTYESLFSELPTTLPSTMKKKVLTEASPKIKRTPRSPDIHNMSPDEFSFCTEVLQDLEKSKHKKYSWPFLYPVTEQDAPGYFSVISQPMDLSTVRSKLDGRKYTSSAEFIADLNLIVENCFKFNKPETEVYKCGEELNKAIQNLTRRDVDGRISEIRRKISQLTQELKSLEQQSSKTVFTMSDRERIGKAILQMTKTQTEKVAEIVHRHCAYEYVDNDEIEINLQTMADEVVGEIEGYLQKIKNGEGEEPSSEE